MSTMMPQKPVCWIRALGAVLLFVMMASGSILAQPTVKEIVEQRPEENAKLKAKEGAEQELPKPTGPQDEFSRGVPRTTVAGFLAAAAKRDYQRAAEYLDLRNLPRELTKTQGPQLARQLKIVFDRSLWIDLMSLSLDSKGHDNDGLASFRDHVGKIEIPGKKVEILLQQVARGDGTTIWQFSSATVAEIPRLYRTYGYGLLDNIFPNAFFDLTVLGVEIWLWVGLLIIGILAYLAAFVLTKIILLFLQHHPTPMRDQVCRLVRGPLRFLLFLVMAGLMIEYINPPLWFQALLKARTLFSVAVVWMAFWIIDFLIDRLSEHYQLQGQTTARVLLPPLGTAAKTVFVIIAVLVWLDNLGFKVTTLLAGLGIGGLAFALALQKPIENLVSGITLYTSEPVAVGDFCRFGDKIGTVEEIGLRATKVRTLGHTLLTVPNIDFVHAQLENFSKREKIWYHPQVRLRYDTTPDQIRYILVEIRKMFYAHPKVLDDPARIRFEGFGSFSLDLEVFAYIDVTDWGEFLEIAEDLNLRIMDIVQEAGSAFALPSQTFYSEQGQRPDNQLAGAAEQKVHEWREGHQLFLPKFPAEAIAALKGSLRYPPPGSAVKPG
ncbi:MAG: mechanosensitive ion channel family protein [Nitrospirales bacterium]